MVPAHGNFHLQRNRQAISCCEHPPIRQEWWMVLMLQATCRDRPEPWWSPPGVGRWSPFRDGDRIRGSRSHGSTQGNHPLTALTPAHATAITVVLYGGRGRGLDHEDPRVRSIGGRAARCERCSTARSPNVFHAPSGQSIDDPTPPPVQLHGLYIDPDGCASLRGCGSGGEYWHFGGCCGVPWARLPETCGLRRRGCWQFCTSGSPVALGPGSRENMPPFQLSPLSTRLLRQRRCSSSCPGFVGWTGRVEGCRRMFGWRMCRR